MEVVFCRTSKEQLNSVVVDAVLDSIGSTGFSDAKLLHTWSSGGAFCARKNPRVPREWEIGSYEGTKFYYTAPGPLFCMLPRGNEIRLRCGELCHWSASGAIPFN
jgi:hypothetical protein